MSHVGPYRGRNSSETPQTETIEAIRGQLVNVVLFTIAGAAVPLLATSLYRIKEIGWQHTYIVHVIASISLWGIAFFHRRISLRIRLSSILSVLFFLGIDSLMTFGLVGRGAHYLIGFTFLAALFSGTGFGAAAMILSLIVISLIGAAAGAGYFSPGFDLNQYAVSSSAWIVTSCVTAALTSS